MRAGNLKECITIFENVQEYDQYGSNITKLNHKTTTRADVTILKEDRKIDVNAEVFNAIVTFYIRNYHTVLNSDVIFYDGNYYRVLSVFNNKRRQLLELKTEIITNHEWV